ncbi:hypothetical protein C0995_015354 [Termitomyces sp. Mi166|nr:hypothetical protein C0995_015354 [Termitomyces sp. Mi166\
MAKTELIDGRVSVDQCKLAIDALYAHETKKEKKLQENELLPGKEPNIWLNITVKKIPSGLKFKPAKIPIVHPLIDPRTTSICLITKDPQREYKDLLETHNVKFISRVVGIEKLKGKFKPFEARRILLKENGLFLADERIIPLLPKLLGVKWFEAKKQPIPVCLKRKDLKGELERAVSSTYMNQNRGTCTSVKFAALSHTPKQILENLKVALPAITRHIVTGWDNIQALHIKTNSSVSLPIWCCTLDEAEDGRWPAAEQEWTGFGTKVDQEASDTTTELETGSITTAKNEPKIQDKGKKRAQEEEYTEKPNKKAKGMTGQSVTESLELMGKSSTVTSTFASTSKSSLIEGNASSKKPKSDPSSAAEAKSTPSNPKSSKKSAVPVESMALAHAKYPVKASKKKASSLTATALPAVSSVTNDELKQKRSGAPGEKKKSKISATGAKSAKDRILGKKVAQ